MKGADSNHLRISETKAVSPRLLWLVQFSQYQCLGSLTKCSLSSNNTTQHEVRGITRSFARLTLRCTTLCWLLSWLRRRRVSSESASPPLQCSQSIAAKQCHGESQLNIQISDDIERSISNFSIRYWSYMCPLNFLLMLSFWRHLWRATDIIPMTCKILLQLPGFFLNQVFYLAQELTQFLLPSFQLILKLAGVLAGAACWQRLCQAIQIRALLLELWSWWIQLHAKWVSWRRRVWLRLIEAIAVAI